MSPYVTEIEGLKASLSELRAENARLVGEVDESKAACAAMRQVLDQVWNECEMGWITKDGSKWCGECDAKAPLNLKSLAPHEPDCLQGKIAAALHTPAGKLLLEELAQEKTRNGLADLMLDKLNAKMKTYPILESRIHRLEEVLKECVVALEHAQAMLSIHDGQNLNHTAAKAKAVLEGKA